MRKTVRGIASKTLTCLLIACMLAGIGGLTAYAEGEDRDTTLVVNEPQGSVEAGNITIDVANDDATGIEVTSSSGTGGGTQVQTGDVSVTVNADDGSWYDGFGLDLIEGNNAINSIETGSISVSVTVEDEAADVHGIFVADNGGGHQTTIKTGDINVTASGDNTSNAVGVDVYNARYVSGDGSNLEIAVNGNITAHDDLSTASGIRVFNNEGTNNSVHITVNGDITATVGADDEYAEGMNLNAEGTDNSTAVVVDGNVTADTTGMMILAMDGGTLDVVVTDTISGKGEGIVFDDDTDASKTSITTWKIESEGPLVDDLYGTLGPAGITDLAKQVIHYIVKLVQPDQGNVLNAVKADGSALDTKTYKVSDDEGEQTVSTENEGKIVRLTLSDDRYEIVSAENVDGTPLSKDDKGFFYSVTRGGGILLSAILREKIGPKPDPKPQPDPDPKPQPQPQPSGGTDSVGGGGACGIKIIYELDGGTYKGDPGPIIRYCMPGQLIHLLEAPEKDGFEFGGWHREIGDKIETYSAGDGYRPWTIVTFTAIWNEA